jgi:hypothetical protein
VPTDVRAAAAVTEAAERQRRAARTTEAAIEGAASGTMTVAVTVDPVAMRAAGSGNSTPSEPTPTVKSEPKESPAMATEQETKIAELEKRNARLEKLSTLTDAQRNHLGTLRGVDADAFIGKSVSERNVVLADIAKADEVVYTSPVDGSVYRKSDDRRLIEMAKRNDETTAALAAAEIAKRDAEFAKRGDEVLTHFAKGLKGNLRARLMKAVNTEFADPAEYEEAITALKGMNFAAVSMTKSTGVNPNTDPRSETPSSQFAALTKRLMTEKGLSEAAATVAALETAEGAQIYAQIPVGRA